MLPWIFQQMLYLGNWLNGKVLNSTYFNHHYKKHAYDSFCYKWGGGNLTPSYSRGYQAQTMNYENWNVNRNKIYVAPKNPNQEHLLPYVYNLAISAFNTRSRINVSWFGCLLTEESPWYPFDRRLGDVQICSGNTISGLGGNWTSHAQSVASFSHWAIVGSRDYN
jgi:hypothetical protein